MRGALASLYTYAYQAPALLGPEWHNWPISQPQATQLAVATEGLLRTLPRRSKEATQRTLSRYLPWVTFVSTLMLVTWPKVLMTQNAKRASAAGIRPGIAHDSVGTAAGRAPSGVPGPVGYATPDSEVGARIPTWGDLRAARGTRRG